MRTGSEQASKKEKKAVRRGSAAEFDLSLSLSLSSYLDLGAERGALRNPDEPPTRPPLLAASAASTGTRKSVAAAKAAAASVAEWFDALSPSASFFFDAAETITALRAAGSLIGRATGARRLAGRIAEVVALAVEGARTVCMRRRERRRRKKEG